MARAIVDTSTEIKISLAPATVYEEILQNIATLLATAKFSVPLDRALGLSQEFVDKPHSVAKTMIVQEVMDAIERYEPRVTVLDITFSGDVSNPGLLKPMVEVEFNV